MTSQWIRKGLRLAAFAPALVLGSWLVSYTQRQAARPPNPLESVPVSASATENDDPYAALVPVAQQGQAVQGTGPGETAPPHVIRITSKRIEMPVFKLKELSPPIDWSTFQIRMEDLVPFQSPPPGSGAAVEPPVP